MINAISIKDKKMQINLMTSQIFNDSEHYYTIYFDSLKDYIESGDAKIDC